MHWKFIIVRCAMSITLAFFLKEANAQVGHTIKKTAIQPLTVGDSLPVDLFINKTIGYKSRRVNLSDPAFRDKVILLDFFGTWCPGCIEALPALDSLNRADSSMLAVIVVTDEKEEKVRAFWKKNPLVNLKNIQLPVAVEDTVLSSYFPHFIVPHEVWIRNGVVLAITTPEFVSSNNIKKAYAGERFDWPVKKDIIGFDRKKPVFEMAQGSPIPIGYSALTSYINGVPYVNAGFVRDSARKMLRVYAINFSIIDLYTMAVGEQLLSNHLPIKKSLILETTDSARFFKPAAMYRSVWEPNHEFTYESTFPIKTSDKEAKEKMIADINSYLRLDAGIQRKSVECLLLQKMDTARLPPAAPDGPWTVELSARFPYKRIANARISTLADALNELPGLPPVVDETGITDNVSLDLSNIDLSNIDALNAVLKPYGLIVRKGERTFNMLVISEKDSMDTNTVTISCLIHY